MAEKIIPSDLETLFPNLSRVGAYDSPGKILRTLKELNTELNPEHQDFRGWDWIQEKFGIGVGGDYIDKWKKSKEVLSDRYLTKGFAPDDSYTGAQERYDRPPKMMEMEMEEEKVKELIKRGDKTTPYEGPFGKLGEHFSKNAAARDKMFQYLGSMGREMVKPIEPGKEAAGALVPTLSRGFEKGETEYAAKQAAATKRMLDMASAQQKINPLQYFSNKMKEARAMVPQGTDPDSAEGKKWIANHLRSVGMPGQLVDLTTSLENLNLKLMTESDETEIKKLKTMIDSINQRILDLASRGMGGTTTTGAIDYTKLISGGF